MADYPDIRTYTDVAISISGSESGFVNGRVMQAKVVLRPDTTLMPTLTGPYRITGKASGQISLSNLILKDSSGKVASYSPELEFVTIELNKIQYQYCFRTGGGLSIREVLPQVYAGFGSLVYTIYDVQADPEES